MTDKPIFKCKNCGTINDILKTHCSKCGKDLNLFADVILQSDDIAAPESMDKIVAEAKSEVNEAGRKETPIKEQENKKPIKEEKKVKAEAKEEKKKGKGKVTAIVIAVTVALTAFAGLAAYVIGSIDDADDINDNEEEETKAKTDDEPDEIDYEEAKNVVEEYAAAVMSADFEGAGIYFENEDTLYDNLKYDIEELDSVFDSILSGIDLDRGAFTFSDEQIERINKKLEKFAVKYYKSLKNTKVTLESDKCKDDKAVVVWSYTRYDIDEMSMDDKEFLEYLEVGSFSSIVDVFTALADECADEGLTDDELVEYMGEALVYVIEEYDMWRADNFTKCTKEDDKETITLVYKDDKWLIKNVR